MKKYVRVLKPFLYIEKGDLLELTGSEYKGVYLHSYQGSGDGRLNLHKSVIGGYIGDYFEYLTEEEFETELFNKLTEAVAFTTENIASEPYNVNDIKINKIKNLVKDFSEKLNKLL